MFGLLLIAFLDFVVLMVVGVGCLVWVCCIVVDGAYVAVLVLMLLLILLPWAAM